MYSCHFYYKVIYSNVSKPTITKLYMSVKNESIRERLSLLLIHHTRASLSLGERFSPSGGKQQGGRPAPVAEGEAADAGHTPPAENADDGG